MRLHRHRELDDCVAESMAAHHLASLVDLRAGAILFVLAAVDPVSAATMDAAGDSFGGDSWNRISNWVRNVFGSNGCPLGPAFWQSRFTCGGRGAGLVRWTVARNPHRMAAG